MLENGATPVVSFSFFSFSVTFIVRYLFGKSTVYIPKQPCLKDFHPTFDIIRALKKDLQHLMSGSGSRQKVNNT